MTGIDYDKIAADYSAHRTVHPAVLKALTAACGAGPTFSVLEVGCGTGNYVDSIFRTVGARCVGVDPSREMLVAARRRCSKKVRFMAGDARALELDPDSFDLAFSVDVVHHFREHLDYFAGLHRVLKPGGRACTVTDSEWIIKRRTVAHYFPETVRAELARYPKASVLRLNMKSGGFVEIVERTVEMKYKIKDLAPFREKAYSCLRIIPEHAFKQGIARMEEDLAAGPIMATSRYLMMWGKK